ncbi:MULTISPECIES: hypothetical protein [Furfurilactobacillus]|uniref:Uncharacterized protein n=1 Tax=Furfurilactobacillus rossiae TaxID=231049 RepID=A0A7C9J1T1_9LACO|nr:hypothetical protein [Furfurilactobacillus milii]MYV05678.1 hypothetical protein [Furfurilactobacillus milii]
MNDEELIQLGLSGKAPLKVILAGWTESNTDGQKVGVVGLLYVTTDVQRAQQQLTHLRKQNPEHYYMVYSVPYDTDLSTLSHWPTLEIEPEDLA